MLRTSSVGMRGDASAAEATATATVDRLALDLAHDAGVVARGLQVGQLLLDDTLVVARHLLDHLKLRSVLQGASVTLEQGSTGAVNG
jgi:hypothetical protein